MLRIDKLKALESQLKEAMDLCKMSELASIAKQYRETIREIEEIEGMSETDDEIGEILAEREADGKPGAVRKARAKL